MFGQIMKFSLDASMQALAETNAPEEVESLHDIGESTEVVEETGDRPTVSRPGFLQRLKTPGKEALRSGDTFIKRSQARAAMDNWKDGLEDAEHAIKLNPSSPWGYERKHAALHGAQDYEDAIEAFNTMLSKLDNSPDPRTHKLRQQYVSPSDLESVIQIAIDKSLQNSPLRLIDTTTGYLCDRDERINTFKATPYFKELISSMTTNVTFDHERIAEVVMKYFRHVMLSHRWEGKEPLLSVVQNKSVYDLEPVYPVTKLQRFCQTARDAGYTWGWSDTCCIDKTNSVELQQSLNSIMEGN
ncbi:hypothetical protein BJ138DRAFT_1118949 [Hygrophoropsis aurantiaca]|uniref:Uncharacterized protein n=1 Tax=Hygrophoropsis aurantiaca TaxID=72124 RepID=A0ACB7ZW29_9AGAM|nr:hypothetical protein BJ138DRAFT_1118949 [Hygrophoropsis aurantiaca]